MCSKMPLDPLPPPPSLVSSTIVRVQVRIGQTSSITLPFPYPFLWPFP